MKKHFLLFVSVTLLTFCSLAQSSFTMPLILKNDDGSSEFFDLKAGDKLVYQVNAGGSEYEFIVTLNDPGANALDFNYEMTNTNKTSGHVTISGKAKTTATKYINYFSGGDLNLTDACTVWLSNKNFNDMTERKTVLQLDNNAPETFYLPKKDTVSTVVKVKGEDKKVEAFIINNAADGNGKKTMWIHDISSNSLIIKMDQGWSIILKEIR